MPSVSRRHAAPPAPPIPATDGGAGMRRTGRAWTLAALLAAMLLLPGCGDPDGTAPEDGAPVVEREVFIQSYVALRSEALLHGGEMTDSLRSAVLQRQGVTEDQLLRFAEVRGTDVPFMQEVWAEVERRLEARRVPLDSVEPLER